MLEYKQSIPFCFFVPCQIRQGILFYLRSCSAAKVYLDILLQNSLASLLVRSQFALSSMPPFTKNLPHIYNPPFAGIPFMSCAVKRGGEGVLFSVRSLFVLGSLLVRGENF